jgi:stress-induced-phosphoprotein 1
LSEREAYLLEMNFLEARTLRLKGDSVHELGKYVEAVEAYRESLKINAADTDAWRNKSKSLLELGKFDDVIDAETELLKLNAADTDAWLRKGMLHALMKDYNVAIECFDGVLQIDPNNVEPRYYKGRTQEESAQESNV